MLIIQYLKGISHFVLYYLDANTRTDLQEIKRRLKGLDIQKEFLLILKFLDVSDDFSGFDESISMIGKAYTPDLIIKMKNGENILVEVKSTGRDFFEISLGNLENRCRYAADKNLKLFFAISIKGFWMMFPSEYLKEKRGKIVLGDFKNSIFDEQLDTMTYIMPSHLKIRSIYKKETNKGLGIQYAPYGELISYELFYKNERILKIKGKDSMYKTYAFLLEALEDRLSTQVYQISSTSDTTEILALSRNEEVNYIPEYEFILAPLLHTLSEEGEKNSINSIVSSLIAKKKIEAPKKELIRSMMGEFVSMGIPIMYMIEDKIYRFSN